MRIGEVGDGELAVLGVARIGVRCQQLGAVPGLLAELRHVAETIVEAKLGDAVDVAQRFAEFEIGVVLEAPLERGDDLRLAQAVAARATHGEDEREAELLVVGGIEVLQRGQLVGAAVGEAGLALFMRRLGGQRLGRHRLAGQLRMGAQEGLLSLQAGTGHGFDEHALELGQARERPARFGPIGDPGRVFVDALEQHAEHRGRCAVELVEGELSIHAGSGVAVDAGDV